MVLKLLYKLSTSVLSTAYYTHAAIAVTTFVIIYAFSQGRTTNRDRDLHARTIIITGGFSPLGLTLVSSLASRGAHVIAVSPYPLSHPQPALLIPALRATTNNEKIYAEYADLSSPKSIREFCTQFLTGDDQRVDAIVYAHEYRGVGSFFGSSDFQEERRTNGSLATFLMTTLLLPALLVAPVERDIRIINVVNPFYAAAVPSFTSSIIDSLSSKSESSSSVSVFVSEGHRALRTVVFTRHLQRILTALPNRAPTLDQHSAPGVSPPKPAQGKSVPFPSNTVAVSACPGISRIETISTLLGGEWEHDPEGYSTFGHILYFILFPIIWFFAKGASMAMQSVLHVLFLPTPFKRALAHAYAAADPSSLSTPKPSAESGKTETTNSIHDMFTEVLKPGALYRECSVVTLTIPPLPSSQEQASENDANKEKTAGASVKASGSKEDTDKKASVDLNLEDDGEFGGESTGRVVWEWYERKLNAWEAAEQQSQQTEPSKQTETEAENIEKA